MSDIKLALKNFSGDIFLDGFDLAQDNGLETAVIVSLFTDRRAEADDILPDGTNDRRGWWADAWPEIDDDKIGSKLWLLSREKQLQPVVNRAREYAQEALQWLVDDGIAKEVKATAEIVRRGVLGLSVDIFRPDGSKINFIFDNIWEAMNAVLST